jgi:hypothetical protein
VHGQVPERAPEGDEGAGPAGVTVGQRQADIRLVTTPQQDVTVLQVLGHLLRVPEKV